MMTAIVAGAVGQTDMRVNLEQKTPLLPAHELRAFVEHFLAKGNGYLEILNKYPPPVYILETRVLEERAAQFQTAFRRVLPDTAFYYAVKSNNHPEVARTLLNAGLGLDVSSGPELEMALALDARDIIFSGPGKTAAELALAVQNEDRVTILIDSFGELARLDEIAASQQKTVRAGVRLTTKPHGLWRKFGILPEQLALFWEKISQSRQLHFQGLQFHTSWNLTPSAQVDFIRLLGKVLRSLPGAALNQLRFVDIGGGYWPGQGEWLQAAGTDTGKLKKILGMAAGPASDHFCLSTTPIEDFAEELGRAIGEHIHSVVPCCICFELGRWLCNDAMHLLLSVVDKKCDDLVITDAGTNAVGWERFETDYFPVLNLSRPALEEKTCNILGALCTPHDVWGYNYWGEDIRVGDILMIPTQGAYTFSLRQNFIKPLPRVVTL